MENPTPLPSLAEHNHNDRIVEVPNVESSSLVEGDRIEQVDEFPANSSHDNLNNSSHDNLNTTSNFSSPTPIEAVNTVAPVTTSASTAPAEAIVPLEEQQEVQIEGEGERSGDEGDENGPLNFILQVPSAELEPSTNSTTSSTPSSPARRSSRSSNVFMPSNDELLLREWNYNTDMDIDHNDTGNNGNDDSTDGSLPPVAPAVVLNETSEGSSNTASGATTMATTTSHHHTPASRIAYHSYPVATFVSNFVRSSVNEIRDHIINVTAVPETSHDDGDHSGTNNHRHNPVVTTIRSDPTSRPSIFSIASTPAISARSAPEFVIDSTRSSTRADAPSLHEGGASSTRSFLDSSATIAVSSSRTQGQDLDHFYDDEDHNTEYVLIDGDLVAISDIHEQYMDDYDYRPGRQQRQMRRQERRRQRASNSNNNYNRSSSSGAIQESSASVRSAPDLLVQDDESGAFIDRSHSSSVNHQQHHSAGTGTQSQGPPQSQQCAQSATSSPTSASVKSSSNHLQSRMHRGMRKVKKWMKKKNLLPRRSNINKASGSNSAPTSQITLDSLAESVTSSHIDSNEEYASGALTATTALAASASTLEDSALDQRKLSSRSAGSSKTNKSQRKPHARGLSWMLRESGNEQEASTNLESRTETSVASLPAPRSVPAVASLPPGPAQQSYNTYHPHDPLADADAMYGPGTLEASALAPAYLQSSFGDVGHRRTASNSSALMSAMEASASLLPLDHESPSLNRQVSTAAEYVGYIGNGGGGVEGDYLFPAGVLPDNIMAAEAYIEDRLDDYDKYDKKDDGMFLRSMVPRDADFKVDKQEAPCVDSMLRRAGEFVQDTDPEEDVAYAVSPYPPAMSSLRTAGKGKSDGESIPLSIATSKDTLVHNDILKLVMVGDARVDKSALARSIRQSSKKSRKKRTTLGVDVHSWTPPNDDDVKFTIWDVQGASMEASPYDANFGAHPGTQALFFSDRSLYLLVWDLAVDNRRTFRRDADGGDSDDDDDVDGDDDNEYLREEASREAHRALESDIEERVLSWVDCISIRGPHSAILPIALVSGGISPEEAKRRCDIMQVMMMSHTEKMENAPKVLSGAETALCVSLDTNMGMDLLEATILAIATDVSHSVFDHIGTPVPLGTTMVLETCRRLKSDHKLVLVDHLLAELSLLKNETGIVLSVDEVMECLHFLSSIGECLYFGGIDDVLSHYVILSRKWLVSALSCILRNDLKRELLETRRFMNMQCLYSDQRFPENPVTQTFSTSASNCPLLSSSDTRMLWQSMNFMREAADMTSQLRENATTSSTMFGFLEHLLVHTGIFLPLDIDRFTSPDVVYFVPSLLAQANTKDIWTYKSSEAWMTTLAHSWLFRDGTPIGLMEHVTVGLLRDLYEFSHVVAAKAHVPPARSQTFPFAQNSLTEFIDNYDGEAIGHIKIHQMMCWKHSLLVKIGCMFPDGNELRESFVEIFVTLADPSSPHCVASDAMRSNMQRLIVSGKGQVGHHGRKLWRGGYNIVLDSIKASVASCTNVDPQVVCPECLAHAHPSAASTWSWDAVRAAAGTGSTIVRCMRGHRADSNLICGTVKAAGPKSEGLHGVAEGPQKPVKELLPSVVLVGLFDPKTSSIRNVGSGFIVDKKQGLVVTAAHILFDMEGGRNFGNPFFGLKNAKIVIGVIPQHRTLNNENTATFRYLAEIVADEIHSMDACVLKVTSRLERDVDDETLVGGQSEEVVDFQEEQLLSLKTTRRYELEESVRIIGFNQAGEGWLEQGKHVNKSADFAKGYICKQFKLVEENSDSDSDDTSSSECGFSPREEIVIMCPTIPGHSGGPCVNEDGKVVGILSRADPVDRQRCYLVPASELKILVNKARKSSSRVAGLKRPY